MKNNYTEIMSGEEVLRSSLSSAPDGRPLAKRVFFEAESWEVGEEFTDLIKAHADYLKQNPDRMAVISGHSFSAGSHRYCWLIGERRSRAVARALIRAGVKPAQIAGLSKGAGSVSPEADEKAAKYRRRVNIDYCAASEVEKKLAPQPGMPSWWKNEPGALKPATKTAKQAKAKSPAKKRAPRTALVPLREGSPPRRAARPAKKVAATL